MLKSLLRRLHSFIPPVLNSECPKGGRHSWFHQGEGVYVCGKCGKIKST